MNQKATKAPTYQQIQPALMPYVTYTSITPSKQLWRGFQTTWDLCAITEGQASWRYRGKTMTSPAGCIRLKEPGENFQTLRVEHPSALRILHFDPAFISQTTEDLLPHSLELPCFQIQRPDFFQQLGQWISCLTSSSSLLEKQEGMYLLLKELLFQNQRTRQSPQKIRCHPAVRRAQEYIEAHLTEDISLDTLAQIAAVHPVYLSRLFRQHVGLPPHAYQLEQRIQLAQQHLKAGMSSAEVAIEVGFFDQSHLLRHFKRHLGLTPERFRHLAQKQTTLFVPPIGQHDVAKAPRKAQPPAPRPSLRSWQDLEASPLG